MIDNFTPLFFNFFQQYLQNYFTMLKLFSRMPMNSSNQRYRHQYISSNIIKSQLKAASSDCYANKLVLFYFFRIYYGGRRHNSSKFAKKFRKFCR